MPDLHFTTVNSPSATHTKDGSDVNIYSNWKLEKRITALDWIMLLRNMVMERNLRECECKQP